MVASQFVLRTLDADERSYINSMFRGSSLADFTRARAVGILSFAASAVAENDTLSVELVNGLLSKISAMSDGDWETLKVALPFDVPYDSPDADSPIDSQGIVLPLDENGDSSA